MARTNNNTNPEETKVEETKATENTEAVKEEAPKRVEIFIPRSSNPNEDPNMFVSVNGVNYLLPRGKKSLVPVEIAEEIERSVRAQSIFDEHVDEMRMTK